MTLVSASWAIRNSAVSTSGGSRARLVVQFAGDASALPLLGHDALRREPLRLIGLLADGGRVRLESVPQRVHFEHQAGHVRIGEGRQARAGRVVTCVEALRGLA